MSSPSDPNSPDSEQQAEAPRRKLQLRSSHKKAAPEGESETSTADQPVVGDEKERMGSKLRIRGADTAEAPATAPQTPAREQPVKPTQPDPTSRERSLPGTDEEAPAEPEAASPASAAETSALPPHGEEPPPSAPEEPDEDALPPLTPEEEEMARMMEEEGFDLSEGQMEAQAQKRREAVAALENEVSRAAEKVAAGKRPGHPAAGGVDPMATLLGPGESDARAFSAREAARQQRADAGRRRTMMAKLLVFVLLMLLLVVIAGYLLFPGLFGGAQEASPTAATTPAPTFEVAAPAAGEGPPAAPAVPPALQGLPVEGVRGTGPEARLLVGGVVYVPGDVVVRDGAWAFVDHDPVGRAITLRSADDRLATLRY